MTRAVVIAHVRVFNTHSSRTPKGFYISARGNIPTVASSTKRSNFNLLQVVDFAIEIRMS